MKPMTKISFTDIAENRAFCLDMTSVGGKGVLKRPVKNLVKVLLHRLGILFSVEDTGHAWRVIVRRRGGGKIRQPGRFFASSVEAENHFLFTAANSLPPQIVAALTAHLSKPEAGL